MSFLLLLVLQGQTRYIPPASLMLLLVPTRLIHHFCSTLSSQSSRTC
ncbi:hypothetical protein HanHA300_Chr03g0106201 [Helianthus annuus]|nr:hypothetical protein HanHA300_Chr03g0106201 [Helianthus annuus]KAJ0609256.1 hypothetical protein HanHA89_Chr03g0117911 [Helianthus annuus]